MGRENEYTNHQFEFETQSTYAVPVSIALKRFFIQLRQSPAYRQIVGYPYARPPYGQLLLLFVAALVMRKMSKVIPDAEMGGMFQMVFGVVGLLYLVFLLFRYFAEQFRVERRLKRKEVPCIWCGYTLDTMSWPQQCSECGRVLERSEVLHRWSTKADMGFLEYQEEQET